MKNLRLPARAVLAMSSIASALIAQTPALQMGAVYQRPGGQSFKVLSCAGSANADLCDVKSYSGGQPNMRGKSTHEQVMAMLPLCHLQTTQGCWMGGEKILLH